MGGCAAASGQRRWTEQQVCCSCCVGNSTRAKRSEVVFGCDKENGQGTGSVKLEGVPRWDSESFFVSLTFVSTQPRPKSEKMRTMADCRFSHHTTRGGISLSDHCIVEWIGGELGAFFCWRRQRRSKGAEEQEGKKEKVKNTGRKKVDTATGTLKGTNGRSTWTRRCPGHLTWKAQKAITSAFPCGRELINRDKSPAIQTVEWCHSCHSQTMVTWYHQVPHTSGHGGNKKEAKEAGPCPFPRKRKATLFVPVRDSAPRSTTRCRRPAWQRI